MSFPGEAIAEARASLASCLAEVTAADTWLATHPPVLSWIEGQFEPGQTSLSEPIVEELSAAHNVILGHKPGVQGVPYGSDLRLLQSMERYLPSSTGQGTWRLLIQSKSMWSWKKSSPAQRH